MFRPFLVGALLLASPAFAGKEDPEWNPPARFDKAYPGQLTIHQIPQRELVEVCRALFKKYKIKATASFELRGCSAITSETTCTVVIPDKTYKRATPEAILRHEIGHCNRWPNNHPD